MSEGRIFGALTASSSVTGGWRPGAYEGPFVCDPPLPDSCLPSPLRSGEVAGACSHQLHGALPSPLDFQNSAHTFANRHSVNSGITPSACVFCFLSGPVRR